jgi:GntR family transcriptional repressor for pyruvate dehydrogenase complex
MPSRRSIIPFQPPARRRIHESVAEQLRDAILDGRLVAGQKLPPERELAEKFQVNRTSIREAIKVLEGLKLVSVRQGDGATVQPLSAASLGILPAMINHGGRIDARALAEAFEVIMPLFFEMARMGIERVRPEHLAELRRLRAVAADEASDREVRFEAGRQVLALVADMTGNRVWQMLARKVGDFLRSEPMRQTRHALRRDPGQIVPTMDRCLSALDAGRPQEALEALRGYIIALGEAIMSLNGGRSRVAATGGTGR